MLLESEVCSCAKLQAFSCYRGWKEACQMTRVISRTSRCELLSSSPPPRARQSTEGNSHHSDRNIRGTCTIVCHRQQPGTCNPEETGLPVLPVSWSPTLISRSGPVKLPSVPWTQQTIERSPFFVQRRGHCCRRDLVGRTIFWFPFFFWVVCKS